MARLGQAVALTMVAVACGTPSDPGFDLITETARSEFALEETFVAVPFTVTNLSAGTIYYLNNCAERPNVVIDRHEGGRWVMLYGGICIGVAQGPAIPLHPYLQPGKRSGHLGPLRLRFSRNANRVADWRQA